MRVGAVEWLKGELDEVEKSGELIKKMALRLQNAAVEQAELVVFPAFTGCFHQLLARQSRDISGLLKEADSGEYLERIAELSKNFQGWICPGSYWEREGNSVFHTSSIVYDGRVVHKQRQIYLARWERDEGLSRGTEAELTEIREWKVGIVLATDVFYPQVSRMLALKGADLILSPVGLTGERCEAMQISGMWQETQQNRFFAVESGFNGTLAGRDLWGESAIHAPLEMTQGEDGFMDRSRSEKPLVAAVLDNEARKRAAAEFNVLSRLNPELYRRMGMFGGRG